MGGLVSALWSANTHLFTAKYRPPSPQTSAQLRSILSALESCSSVNDLAASEDVPPFSDDTFSVSACGLQQLLQQVTKGEDLLQVCSDTGYHVLQICGGHNAVDMVRWLLSLDLDVNAGACSLPLHIACYRGYEQCVRLLLDHGARADLEVVMCWPGSHGSGCRLHVVRSDGHRSRHDQQQMSRDTGHDRPRSAVYWAVGGDQVGVLKLLASRDNPWLPCFLKQPLLHVACELGSWHCLQYLLAERPSEINQCIGDCYPIHKAALNHVRFLECLIQHGADTLVLTTAQHLSLLHVVFLVAKKSAADTLVSVELMLKHGLKQLVNTSDSLGNTPLHALIVRHSLEEGCYGYDDQPSPWKPPETLQLIQLLLENGAAASLNLADNSVLACVLRHVKDWQFRYQLVQLFLDHGANPHVAGRDGSVPLMICLLPLINKDSLHSYSSHTKSAFLNCVSALCEGGADPNCSARGYLTPLHVLIFSASESIALNCHREKAETFSFILQLLSVLLRYGLDTNVRFNRSVQHVLLAVVELVGVIRHAADLDHVYATLLTLLQYGANADVTVSSSAASGQHRICHSQSSLFLRSTCHSVLYHFVQQIVSREHLLLDPERRYERVITLLSSCMQHGTLYSCLRVLQTQSCIAPVRGHLAGILRRLQTNPRSLKQMCCLVIYTALKRRPALYVTDLPLPPPIQRYLLMVDH